MDVEVMEEASKLGVVIETDVLDDIEVRPSRKEVFDILAAEVKSALRERYQKLSMITQDPKVKSYRNFYSRIGIDPTKTRPSSEALVRRLWKKSIPRINNMVDAGNLSSAGSLIPIGLYDVDEIEGDLSIRLSNQGEIFRGIGGKDEIMEGGIPVLADDRGIIHLYPHRDSMRTRITEKTADVLMVACGVRGIRPRDMMGSLEGVVYHYEQLRS